jgi:hypothetical protein
LVDKSIKSGAIRFINREIERVLKDLESGVINKDQAIGSLNTLFNVSSGVEDTKYMQTICRIIAYIRSTNIYFQIKKLYINKYFNETNPITEEKKEKEMVRMNALEQIVR